MFIKKKLFPTISALYRSHGPIRPAFGKCYWAFLPEFVHGIQSKAVKYLAKLSLHVKKGILALQNSEQFWAWRLQFRAAKVSKMTKLYIQVTQCVCPYHVSTIAHIFRLAI